MFKNKESKKDTKSKKSALAIALERKGSAKTDKHKVGTMRSRFSGKHYDL